MLLHGASVNVIMGNSHSDEIIGEERLEEYRQLTYLSKSEIRHILKVLNNIQPGKLKENTNHRFSRAEIDKALPEICHNPFRDSIYRVFSSEGDDLMSFEDVLDLYSAFSENCPANVRAAWAFKIFDFDSDNRVSAGDLIEAIQRLTRSANGQFEIDRESAEQVARMIIEEMGVQHVGSIGPEEFIRLVTRIPDFVHTFRLKI